MSKIIKSIRVKLDGSSFSENVIGADAINIDVNVNDTTQNLQKVIDDLKNQIQNASIEWNKGLTK